MLVRMQRERERTKAQAGAVAEEMEGRVEHQEPFQNKDNRPGDTGEGVR